MNIEDLAIEIIEQHGGPLNEEQRKALLEAIKDALVEYGCFAAASAAQEFRE